MTRFMSALLILGLILSQAVSARVVNTKHNLSATGPGDVKASSESKICIFCHAPHRAAPVSPLWNREDSGVTYTPYNSSTVKASIGQPTGSSILCLSCHDGTVALGKVVSRDVNIQMRAGMDSMPNRSTRLGTDLSDDHPVSFTYNSNLANQSNGELVQPASLNAEVKLDHTGQLQCTSCHDPHKNDFGKFLVMSNIGGALCESCHQKSGWTQTPHNLSSANWDGSVVDPWPNSSWTTVRDNACQNCHQPHNANEPERLLNSSTEETTCMNCHNGHVAAKNISDEFNKPSFHPVDSRTGVHDPSETAVVNSRHVECADCHNPHAAKASAGIVAGPLTNVRGVDRNGNEIHPITAEYQLCFRCHADSNGKPAAPTARLYPETNVRLEFDTANPSYHPVVGAGKNPNVPSLINGLTTSSIIKCTDCHNNNSGPGAGGAGPNGPHGSNFNHLLERQFLTGDNVNESTSTYALCYKCHDRDSIRGDESFSEHRKHIFNENASCNICHDPHSSEKEKLINFDINPNIVTPSSSGRLEYNSTGTFSGECYLSCHGKNHNPCSYGPGMGGGGMCGGGGMGGM